MIAQAMKIKDFIKPAHLMDGNTAISTVAPSLKENKIREIIILDDDEKFLGMVTRHSLIDSVKSPQTTKLHTLMFKPHTLKEDDDLETAIEFMLALSVESLPVVNAKQKVLGVVVIEDILEQVDASGLRAADVMSSSPVTINQGANVANAITIMKNHGISRLIVVDDSGKLVGLVSTSDLLDKAFLPNEKLGKKSYRYEQNPYADLPVSSVMTKNVITCTSDTDINTVVDRMLKHNVRTIPVVEDGIPTGLVTRKHILKLVRPRDIGGIRVNISGIKDLESFEVVTIRELIVGHVKKIGKSLDTESVDIVIKKIGESQYQATVHAGKGKNFESTHATAFDVVSAVSQALKILEGKVRHG